MEEVELTWLQPDGKAGGRTPKGKVVRVAGALPGDVVTVDRQGKNDVLKAIKKPSPNRIPATCANHDACGGCDLAELNLSAQHRAKQRLVQVAFRSDTTPKLVPSPRPTAHRARIQLSLQDGKAGYHARRSHQLVDFHSCGVARPEIQAQIPVLREIIAPGCDGLDRVELRSDGSRVVFNFRSNSSVSRELRDRLAKLDDVALDGRVLHGNPSLTLQVAGLDLRASPLAFYQVNLEGNAALVTHVLRLITTLQPERLLGLYAGMGNLELPIAATGVPVVAVEREGQSMVDLDFNAAKAGLSSLVTSVTKPVERFDTHTTPADVILLDPPRAGAAGVLERAIQARPRGIIYVSCHAPSAARDLKPVIASGYQIRDITCFDLFPDTHHVETVVMLERG